MSFHTHFLLRLISVHFTVCINRTDILILFVDIIVISNQIYILIYYISTDMMCLVGIRFRWNQYLFPWCAPQGLVKNCEFVGHRFHTFDLCHCIKLEPWLETAAMDPGVFAESKVMDRISAHNY